MPVSGWTRAGGASLTLHDAGPGPAQLEAQAEPQPQTPTLRSVLTGLLGVWEGEYRHLDPAGAALETFASRQETRLEGDLWFERITYTRPDGSAPEVLDFRARFDGEHQVVFDDPAFEGHSRLVGERHLLFPYRWKARPEVEVVELITLVSEGYRTRLWQQFSHGVLDRMTVIEEHRVAGADPAVWR